MSKRRVIGEKWLVNKNGIQYEFTKIGPRNYDRKRLTEYQMPNRAHGRGKCGADRTRAPKYRPVKEVNRIPTKQVDMSKMKHVRIDNRTTIIVHKDMPADEATSNYRKKYAP